MMLLAPLRNSEETVKYSSNPNCNDGSVEPYYGFHLVEREYNESPLALQVSGIKNASEELQPGKRYYLLQEIRFGYSACKISDYEDFDLEQLNIKLDTIRAEQQVLDKGRFH